MDEAQLVDETPQPRTRDTLVRDLKHLGLASKMTVIVHSSLSTIGWVCGGPVAVIQTIMEVVTPEGTMHFGGPTPEDNAIHIIHKVLGGIVTPGSAVTDFHNTNGWMKNRLASY